MISNFYMDLTIILLLLNVGFTMWFKTLLNFRPHLDKNDNPNNEFSLGELIVLNCRESFSNSWNL